MTNPNDLLARLESAAAKLTEARERILSHDPLSMRTVQHEVQLARDVNDLDLDALLAKAAAAQRALIAERKMIIKTHRENIERMDTKLAEAAAGIKRLRKEVNDLKHRNDYWMMIRKEEADHA